MRRKRYRRRNPTRTYYEGPSALTLAEAGIIQDVFLVALAGAAVYGVYYLLTRNAGTSQQAVSQMLGYTPGPGTAPPGPGGATPQNTIPNPSVWSGQNPVTPWVPPGPTASNDSSDSYSTELGSGGGGDVLGPVSSITAYA
jgi:hypothetical protein